jgi:hypothetical protein
MNSRRGETRRIANTHIFFAQREAVLQRFLCILVQWFALGLVTQCQEEVNEDKCLDKDMTLKGDITQLELIVSHGALAEVAILAYLQFEKIAAREILGIVRICKCLVIFVAVHLRTSSALQVRGLYHLWYRFELGKCSFQARLELLQIVIFEQPGRIRK